MRRGGEKSGEGGGGEKGGRMRKSGGGGGGEGFIHKRKVKKSNLGAAHINQKPTFSHLCISKFLAYMK